MTSRKLDEIARRYRVVAMCGVSGSGKTYCARQLVSQGFMRLSSDEIIWQRYGDEFPALDPEIRQQAFKWAAEEIDTRTAALISNGERIVVDSTMCKRQRREAFRNICRSKGVEPLFVYLKTPLDTIIRRMGERKGIGPDDQIVSEQQLRLFYSGFQAPDEQTPDVITVEESDR